jgi:hypothetical protein
MRWNWQSVVVYVLVALAALGLNATWAQSAQERVSAAHELSPAGEGFGPYEVDGMGPDPAPAAQGGGGWWPHVEEACAVHGCDPNYLHSILMCESNGDPGAAAYNPSSGNMTLGLLQIDEMWGSIAYAGGVEQIWWAAAHLDDVWWACG